MAYVAEQTKKKVVGDEGTAPGNTIPEMATPKAATGPVATPGASNVGGSSNATSGAAKGSKSGAFQDFSKFQDANKEKISALSNITTGRASDDAAEGGSNYSESTKEITTNIGGTSGNDGWAVKPITADSVVNNTEDIKTEYDSLGNPIDYTTGYGLDGAVDAQSDWSNIVQDIGESTDRTGVSSLLSGHRNDGRFSTSAGDSLLLRGNSEFRGSMNDTIESTGTAYTEGTTGENSVESIFTVASDKANADRENNRKIIGDGLSGIASSTTDNVATRTESERIARIEADRALVAKRRAEYIANERARWEWEQSQKTGTITGGMPVAGTLAVGLPTPPPVPVFDPNSVDMTEFKAAEEEFLRNSGSNITTDTTRTTEEEVTLQSIMRILGGGGNKVTNQARTPEPVFGFTPEVFVPPEEPVLAPPTTIRGIDEENFILGNLAPFDRRF